MNDEEVSFNAWVVIGNALHLLLRGVPPEQYPGLDRGGLLALEEALRTVQPAAMLEALRRLDVNGRALLRHALELAYAAAGADASSVLGMKREAAAPVLDVLQ